MTFQPGDKVVVKGLDMAFIVVRYINERIVKLLIEGESLEGMHHLVWARADVLLPNNGETLRAEGLL